MGNKDKQDSFVSVDMLQYDEEDQHLDEGPKSMHKLKDVFNKAYYRFISLFSFTRLRQYFDWNFFIKKVMTSDQERLIEEDNISSKKTFTIFLEKNLKRQIQKFPSEFSFIQTGVVNQDDSSEKKNYEPSIFYIVFLIGSWITILILEMFDFYYVIILQTEEFLEAVIIFHIAIGIMIIIFFYILIKYRKEVKNVFWMFSIFFLGLLTILYLYILIGHILIFFGNKKEALNFLWDS